jgi:predicted P-loop ATPase
MKTNISTAHAELLAKFRITTNLLNEARVQSVTDSETREALGLENGFKGDDLSGLLFPYFDPIAQVRTGARVRLDRLTANNVKYLMEPKCRHLFFAPDSSDLLKNIGVPVLFVEAEKSALALAALAWRSRRPYLIVATGGADGWKRKREKKLMPNGEAEYISGPSPDLDLIHFQGRAVLIVFDSNATTNEKVRKARNAFRKELANRGAAVALVNLPDEDGTVNGPDDYLLVHSDEEMLALLDQSGSEAADLRALLRNDDGTAKASLANAITVLRDATEWMGVLAFNEFSLYPVTREPTPWKKPVGSNWTDVDDILTTDWCQHHKLDVTTRTVREAVQAVASGNGFHPVREFLESLKWDGTPRLDGWLSTYLGAEETDFTKAVGARWMISGVARIFEPGCRADHTLVLEGPQGIQKSTALRTLAGSEWFTDHLSDLDQKDSRIELHGVWIVEFAEFASIRRSQVNQVKSFLSAVSDYFRMPYGVRPQHVPRTNIFAASVNDETPLTDPTGNRRFWPIRCGKINIDALKRDRDQLWAEAVERYRKREPWWLETVELNQLAAEEQDARYEPGVWDQIILAWLEKPTQRIFWIDNPDRRDERDAAKIAVPVEPFNSNCNEVTITDVLLHAVGKEIKYCTQADRNQVARCLASLEWKVDRKRRAAGRPRFYRRPKSVD